MTGIIKNKLHSLVVYKTFGALPPIISGLPLGAPKNSYLGIVEGRVNWIYDRYTVQSGAGTLCEKTDTCMQVRGKFCRTRTK